MTTPDAARAKDLLDLQAFKAPSVPVLPTAAAYYRRRMAVVEGGVGVADTLYVCLKAAGGTYSWRAIISG